MSLVHIVQDHIHAGFTGLWIQTTEPHEAQAQIMKHGAEQNWKVSVWDIAKGIHGTTTAVGDPIAALKSIATPEWEGTDTITVLILHNFHKFVTNVSVLQELWNRVIEGRSKKTFAIILAPNAQLPPEIEKVFVLIEHELPGPAELEAIARELIEQEKDNQDFNAQAITAANGLTRYEAEGSFAIALVRHNKLDPQEVWDQKAQLVKKSGALDVYRGKETFSSLGGLHALKSFASKALASSNHSARPRAKGLLLLGVPGAGKSHFAKALGNETGRPTLVLDVGSMFGSLVGQTEERIRNALRIADAMSPAILFVDEIEKALGGLSGNHQGDSGVGSRLFGTLLTWLNDHASDVFFIGTCNDVSKLPPEFSRAERFDGIFFIDLPTNVERETIWKLYRKVYDLEYTNANDTIKGHVQDEQWTGAEIKSCCRLAALLEVPLAEAAKNIVPVAVTAPDRIQGLREWASNRCLCASTGGIYQHTKTATAQSRRNITKKETANV